MRLAIVDSAGLTHTGHERRRNEDSLLMREPLFMVADGMGGAQAGEVASRMTAEAFAAVDLARLGPEAALRTAIEHANTAIWQRAHSDRDTAGMGTTVEAAVLGRDGRLTFAHVGDSRAYLLRDGVLQRLSEDHSLVGELLRSGRLTEAEAERHPQRSVITRALGTAEQVDIDVFTVDAREGDVVLLCSDGLNTMVPEARIAEVLAAAPSAEAAARELVDAALAGGGEDNVTAVVFAVGDAPATAGEATEKTAILGRGELPGDDERTGRLPILRIAVITLVVLLVAGALGVAAALGLRRSHFIGADSETGRVDIFQGVPVELYGGIELYRPVYRSPLRVSALDPGTRERLFDHTLRSRDDARRVLRRLEDQAP